MNYETRFKFDKHTITEEYVVDNTAYRASLDIQSPGFCSGMAGYDAHCVGVSLSMQESKSSIGFVGISFPLAKRSDTSNSELMLEPCLDDKGFEENLPPAHKFTPYAERVIERVVTEFIRQRASCIAMGFPLHSITVSVGAQVNGNGKE